MKTDLLNYEKAVEILTSQGKFRIKLGLERVLALLELFDNPHEKLKCIHIAGTNGKGSTCAILNSILSSAGYKTGLYTSPHLISYTERIKICGKNISEDGFAEIISEIIDAAEKNNIQATEFEILTVLAFIYFQREKVDFAIIETGLGGRFDATNVIQNPIMAIITSIDLDHIDRLGSTIEDISFEKAGIIKQNCPVVTSKTNKGIDIIKQKALELNSELFLTELQCRKELSLKGDWQKENLSLVLKAIDILREKGVDIPEKAVSKGLKNTVWQARYQFIEELNLIIDGAHNPSAAKVLVNALNKDNRSNRIWIYSSISTKNFSEIMKTLFRQEDTIILTSSNTPSALNTKALGEELTKLNIKNIYQTQNIKEAIKLYKSIKMDTSTGILAGSLYTAGEFFKEFPQYF